MTDDRWDKLDALAAAATPGPWIRKWASLDVHAMSGDGVLLHQENIDFAVALVNEYATIRDLVAENKALREAAQAVVEHRSADHGITVYSCGLRFDDHIEALDAALHREAEA